MLLSFTGFHASSTNGASIWNSNPMPAKYFLVSLIRIMNNLLGPLQVLHIARKSSLYLHTENARSKSIIFHLESKSLLEQWFYVFNNYSSLMSICLSFLDFYLKYPFDIQISSYSKLPANRPMGWELCLISYIWQDRPYWHIYWYLRCAWRHCIQTTRGRSIRGYWYGLRI